MQYAPAADLMARVIPCPNKIDDTTHSMIVLRVRSNPWIASAAAYVSIDKASYLQVADSVPHVVGAKLLEPVPFATGAQEIGPLVKILGPDAGLLRTLSDGDWKLGRQIMLIEDEWNFIREIEAMGKDVYRVRGILRGRFDSTIKEHPAGSDCYLADARHIVPIKDAAVRIGQSIWLKTQPYSGKSLSLTECPPIHCILNKPPPRWLGRGEAPLGRADGANRIFVLGAEPDPGTLQVFLNGLLLRPGSRGDFALDGLEIVLHEAPKEGSWLLCWYDPAEG